MTALALAASLACFAAVAALLLVAAAWLDDHEVDQ